MKLSKTGNKIVLTNKNNNNNDNNNNNNSINTKLKVDDLNCSRNEFIKYWSVVAKHILMGQLKGFKKTLFDHPVCSSNQRKSIIHEMNHIVDNLHYFLDEFSKTINNKYAEEDNLLSLHTSVLLSPVQHNKNSFFVNEPSKKEKVYIHDVIKRYNSIAVLKTKYNDEHILSESLKEYQSFNDIVRMFHLCDELMIERSTSIQFICKKINLFYSHVKDTYDYLQFESFLKNTPMHETIIDQYL